MTPRGSPSSSTPLRLVIWACAWTVLALAACAVQPPRDYANAEVADAERAFARQAATEGIRASFLANFAADGIAFEPAPVRLAQALAARPAPADPLALRLVWEPAATGVAASGRLGYSTGPSTLQDAAGTRPPRYGMYFSIWRREPEGWRVALDVGIQTPQLAAMATLAPAPAVGPAGAAESDSLRATERDVRSTFGYRVLFTDDAWLLRDQAMPFIGRDAVRQALAAEGDMRLVPADVVVADSGDFAYSYGEVVEAAGGRAANGHYVHLWTRDASGDWRILVAVRPD